MKDVLPFRLLDDGAPIPLNECSFCGESVMSDEPLLRTWNGEYQHYTCAIEAVTEVDALEYAKDTDSDTLFDLMIESVNNDESLDETLTDYKDINIGKIAQWKVS